MLPHAVRRDSVIGRQIFGAFAGCGDDKAGRARPVDHFRNQRRLVAIGHGIDHAGLARLAGEQRAGQRIGLDIDHDDVLARLDRGERMRDAGIRTAGRLDHHIDTLVGNRGAAVIDKAGARDARSVPADGLAGKLGALRIEIGDDRDLEPLYRRHLRQKHRAEFAGADQPGAHRLAGLDARGEEGLQVHVYSAATRCAARILQQRVVGDRHDRREIAVRDPFGAGEFGDVVGAGAQRQIDDLARIGRDVRRRGMHQIAVEHQHRAGLAGRRDDAALRREPRHGVVVERPQRIGRGRGVVAGRQHALFMALRDHHQRAVDRHHLVEEHRDVHGARFRHAVVARPGAVILMPLPDVALERRLGVELELMHVDVLAKELAERFDQPRMAGQAAGTSR